MRVMDWKECDGVPVAYYDESDLANCRACDVEPVYRDNCQNGGFVRCPECGIKTGTSTVGLEVLVPVWNAIMDDDWPDSDPKLQLRQDYGC